MAATSAPAQVTDATHERWGTWGASTRKGYLYIVDRKKDMKLAEHQRLADSGGLIGRFSYGGMPHDVAKRNMTLFAEHGGGLAAVHGTGTAPDRQGWLWLDQ